MSPLQGDTRVGDRPQVAAPAPAPAPDLAAGGAMMATGGDDPPHGPRPASVNRALTARDVDVALAVLMLLALAAWAQAILHEHFDDDELEHTHVIWLITRGHRPFYDFFECDPPFLWFALGLALFPYLYDALVTDAGGHLLAAAACRRGWMEMLNVAGLGARFNTAYHRAEMERMPPALIVQRGWFTIEQQRAIDGYLQAHQRDFVPVSSALGPTFLRRSPPPSSLRRDGG